MLLHYPRSCIGIRSLGDLRFIWWFSCCVCFVIVLFVCVCLFDGVFARRVGGIVVLIDIGVVVVLGVVLLLCVIILVLLK